MVKGDLRTLQDNCLNGEGKEGLYSASPENYVSLHQGMWLKLIFMWEIHFYQRGPTSNFIPFSTGLDVPHTTSDIQAAMMTTFDKKASIAK